MSSKKRRLTKKILLFAGIMAIIIILTACSFVRTDRTVDKGLEGRKTIPSLSEEIIKPKKVDVKIIDKPISWTSSRESLIREYANLHYGKNIVEIVPQVVVVHWTASENCEGVYNYFYGETMPDDGGGRLNVASHFLVDKDGTIYRLTQETALNRHAIGYNWCAIGIENVGGSEGRENLTEAQAEANIRLIKYLKGKYHTIKYVWGHYQQNIAKESGLFIENVPDYFAEKIDPGAKFMLKLHKGLEQEKIQFYKE